MSNEVAAAYATGAVGAILALFQFIGRARDRKKNQFNAIELEKFKQKSELFMSLKKNQIEYNDELLNEVYRVRIALDQTLQTSDLADYRFLETTIKDFEQYYRKNANKVNYMDSIVRHHTHEILHLSHQLRKVIVNLESDKLEDEDKEAMQIACLKLHKLIIDYEQFLRSESVKEFKSLDIDYTKKRH